MVRVSISRGFTMIEILVVIVILAILAAIAIPMYVGQRDRAKNAGAIEGGHTIMVALLSYVAEQDVDGGPWPMDCTRELLVGAEVIRAEDWPLNPFADGLPMESQAAPSPGNYLYRPDPDDSSLPVRHQIVVERKNAAPFVIP